jgi:hypothetical protein
MQEINRAAALLGPKIQECNTRDKQELGAACPVDQTIGLLSSQTLGLPAWSCGLARGGLAVVGVDEDPNVANFRNPRRGLFFSLTLVNY